VLTIAKWRRAVFEHAARNPIVALPVSTIAFLELNPALGVVPCFPIVVRKFHVVEGSPSKGEHQIAAAALLFIPHQC
jgi:hypothetical protein